jgi:hypothetical protein
MTLSKNHTELISGALFGSAPWAGAFAARFLCGKNKVVSIHMSNVKPAKKK